MTVIAIDGPSGVGKSSVSREVARRSGYGYLDTGAMYRAVVWLCLNRGITDPGDVVELIRGADLEISTDPDVVGVEIDGIDVTTEIREPEVSANAQIVSAVPEARTELQDRAVEMGRGLSHHLVAVARRGGGDRAHGAGMPHPGSEELHPVALVSPFRFPGHPLGLGHLDASPQAFG